MRGIWACVFLSACGSNGPEARAPSETAVAIPSARASEAEPTDSPSADDAGACPIVPLRLLVTPMPPATNAPTAFVRLGEDGSVALGPFGTSGQLDRNGCLSLDDEVAVDGSSPAEVWTAYERFVIANGRMQLAGGRSLQIERDGSIVTFDETGRADTSKLLRFEGYRPEAACAARVLLAAFFASMPSMAMSDGHPERLPPPSGSRCFAAQ